MIYMIGCAVMHVTGFKGGFEMKMTDIEIERLWDEFKDVPIDEDECIDIDWQGWSKGTHREEIWYWFDENHSKGVGWLMNEREIKY